MLYVSVSVKSDPERPAVHEGGDGAVEIFCQRKWAGGLAWQRLAATLELQTRIKSQKPSLDIGNICFYR